MGCMLMLLFCAGLSAAADETQPAPAWLSGTKYEWTLDQPVVATWKNAELRFATQSLSEERRIPVVFDRRLDPNHVFSLEANDSSLRETFGRLAAISQGSVSVTSQTVYLGPMASAGRLRTLIALRHTDVQQVAATLSASRRKSLTERRPLNWQNLDTPLEVVQKVAAQRNLRIQYGERLPHDLWSATDLPAISLAEALTLILIQYDLTFRLAPTGTTLELIPIPEKVAIEKKWPLPRAKVEAISRAIQDELPQVVTESTAEELVAQGTQEQLEALELLIRTMTSETAIKPRPKAPTPLSKRRLTFQAKDAPLSAILEKISSTGIQFVFDRAELKRHGIDIDQLVAIDVKDVPPEELFETLFSPLKIDFKVDGLKVVLSPAADQK
ncbi:MAG: hypothetical protein JWN70_5536 [Planctomycetaceae bacterium]|nr:hypothetical protein [Planctomycetaceae bacterium]